MPLLGAIPSGVMSFLRTVVPFTVHGGRVSTFVPTGILFLLFSLPLFLFCKDHNARRGIAGIPWRTAFLEVAHTFRDARQYPGALRFLYRVIPLSGCNRNHHRKHGTVCSDGNGIQERI